MHACMHACMHARIPASYIHNTYIHIIHITDVHTHTHTHTFIPPARFSKISDDARRTVCTLWSQGFEISGEVVEGRRRSMLAVRVIDGMILTPRAFCCQWKLYFHHCLTNEAMCAGFETSRPVCVLACRPVGDASARASLMSYACGCEPIVGDVVALLCAVSQAGTLMRWENEEMKNEKRGGKSNINKASNSRSLLRQMNSVTACASSGMLWHGR